MYDERYIQNLRKKLKRRAERLKSASLNTFYSYLKQFINFIDENFILKRVVNDLCIRNTDAEEATKSFIDNHSIKVSPEEDAYAAMCYLVLKESVGSNESKSPIKYGSYFKERESCSETEAINLFIFNILDFFYIYIDEELEKVNIALVILMKYKYKCEWFCRNKLYKLWQEKEGRKRRIGENKLKINMVEYLYDQGIELTFTEPLSPSGRVDLVLLQKGDRKLIIEGKVFTSKAKIRKDLRQLYSYLEDYHDPFGYLVIFNPTTNNIALDTHSISNTPYINYKNNKKVFLVVINIYPSQSPASTLKKIKFIEITEQYLLS